MLVAYKPNLFFCNVYIIPVFSCCKATVCTVYNAMDNTALWSTVIWDTGGIICVKLSWQMINFFCIIQSWISAFHFTPTERNSIWLQCLIDIEEDSEDLRIWLIRMIFEDKNQCWGGGASEPLRTFLEKRKSLFIDGIRTSYRAAHSLVVIATTVLRSPMLYSRLRINLYHSFVMLS